MNHTKTRVSAGPKSPRELPRSLALAVFSALLIVLAVPNELFKHGSAPLGFIALVPLYLAILRLRGPKSAALVAGLFGALQHAGTSFWLWNFHDYRFWTLGSTTLAYFIVYMVLGLYIWLFLVRGDKARPAAFALLWTGFEYCKSTGFLAYPWGLLPYSLTDELPLLQIADVTGVYGISFMLAIFNAAIAEIILGWGASPRSLPSVPRRDEAFPLATRARIAYATIALVLIAGDLEYGLVKEREQIPQVGSIDTVIVQQDTDPWEDGDEEATLAANISLARKAIAKAPVKPELVVFSETTLRRPYAEFRGYFEKHPASDPLVPFVLDTGAWLFTGAPIVIDWQSLVMTNSAILIDPNAKMVKSYAKMHMVPFAEVIPFWDIPAFRTFMQKVVGIDSGWAMGTEYTIFDLPTKSGNVRFGAPICFEDSFPDICHEFSLRGADLLINLTNTSWSLTDSAEIQHWASARFRAIEARKTLVRSTNGGVSCVVGPHGEIIDSLPLFAPIAKFIRVPVYRNAASTVYVRFGDWFPIAALLLSAALTIILSVREAKACKAKRRR
jgi:apolipoprotein N-acyltransferase